MQRPAVCSSQSSPARHWALWISVRSARRWRLRRTAPRTASISARSRATSARRRSSQCCSPRAPGGAIISSRGAVVTAGITTSVSKTLREPVVIRRLRHSQMVGSWSRPTIRGTRGPAASGARRTRCSASCLATAPRTTWRERQRRSSAPTTAAVRRIRTSTAFPTAVTRRSRSRSAIRRISTASSSARPPITGPR